ncbi:MAG: PKD domain-containing protein [Lentimicrobium sp.]|nr:PKD domain-containing protein [Lentimicrobium sp.]
MRVKFYITMLASVLFIWAVTTTAQTVRPEKSITPIGFDISPRLSEIAPIPPGYVDRTWKEKVIPNKDGFLEEFKTESAWTGPDPVLQDYSSGDRSTATIGKNFSGLSNSSGVAPPDTQGDVGPNHYMQMVNLSFRIWDKNGNSLYGPALSSTLWSGFTGPWTGTNNGDPIVLYDEYADRWIASQFSLPNYPSGPFYELVAVSQTGDPTGAWYRYAYEFANMPDYPKFGVWPDGYYFTINQFAPRSLSFAGAGVCVLDRSAMISGNANAQMLFFNLGTSYGSLLPADADGPTQPTGKPNYLANIGANTLRIWEADIDWANTGNSSVSLVKTLTTQSFSYSGIVINQPGTSQTLDPLDSRLMYRLQYRNFGSYEVMLTNHSVNANGTGRAGVRWYELRNYGSGWSIYQQGTFAPADGNNRWMGSIAMNGNGDIGVGYSVSGTSTYPSIRFAGQTAANSGTGILDVSETSIVGGTKSQTGVNRWGDYSMMSIDPSDDATFWYTTEYSNGGWNWVTRIASFTFAPPVVVAPVANFSGSPVSIMEGQTVSFIDQSSNNPTSWDWTFPGGTPSSSSERNPVVTYPGIGTYDVSLIVSNSAGTDAITKSGYITVTPFVITYCSSAGSNTSLEWINSVSLGSNTITSGNNSGYGDFTNTPFALESGQTYDLALGLGYIGRLRSEYWRVWIDYNMDGDFNDSGETAFSADRRKGSVTGTIAIPAGLTGEARMRVAMKYNAIPASCEQFTYGEVEDYILVFETPVPQPPVANFTGTPTTLAAGGSVQFTDLSTNNPVSWAWTFEGGTPPSSTVQNPAVLYETEGSYTVTLTVLNNSGSDTKTISGYITVTAGGGTGEYCVSQSSSNAAGWISGVAISSFSNPSGASLYSDFTNLTAGLASGSTNNVILTPSNSTQREFWRIWIDFNADGDFDDSGEQVFTANNKKGVVTGTLTIPSGFSGQTRMRITMKNGGSPTPCEIFPEGEVEDYTIMISSGPAVAEKMNAFNIEAYPNPVTDILNIRLSGPVSKVNIKIYDAFGRIFDDFDIDQNQAEINLGKLSGGIYYIGADNGSQTVLKKFIKE